MHSLLDVIGKNIVAVKGVRPDRRHKEVPVEYILFSGGEFFCTVDDQDYYSYHDCSTRAKELYIHKDKARWLEIVRMEDSNDKEMFSSW